MISYKTDIITECYDRSLALLKSNCHAQGVIAAARTRKSVDRNYASIFGRDAAICCLGMVASGDKGLIDHAKKGLLTLARYQAPNGQIPKYVKPENRESDFWYSGCIDATLWWLYAVDHFDRAIPSAGLRKRLEANIARALSWLFCQEHQGMFLIQQNEASDWADIMPRSGFVLYSNALWYAVKKRYGIPTAAKTRHFFRHIFFPFDKSCHEHRRVKVLTDYVKCGAEQRDFYLSFVNFSFWGEDVDVYGNILACLFDVPTREKQEIIVDRILKRRANQPWPIRTLLSPIQRKSCFWRPYMERHKQNMPYQYHNGGIWPYVAGFWVLLLAKLGRKEVARKELERYAQACRLNGWEFNEWLHGKSGKPLGMAGQSWNAAMFIVAAETLGRRPAHCHKTNNRGKH
ncbi:MAG: glycoside hydrolase [Nitrospirota bacterium]|nr:glycoside hydrolase [Nitrospirota bacterium]